MDDGIIRFQGLKVEKAINFKDVYIVLIEPFEEGSKKPIENNVSAFDSNGNFLWKIKKKSFIGQQHTYYTGIYIRDEKLYLYNITGVELMVDHKTGEIISEELIK